MCIQDLSISERAYIRITRDPPAAPAPQAAYSYLPPSSVRLWACYVRGDTGSVGVLLMSPDGGLAVRIPSPAGTLDAGFTASITDLPGIFSGTLYSARGNSADCWIEAIMDADLSKAVQVTNKAISTKGG